MGIVRVKRENFRSRVEVDSRGYGCRIVKRGEEEMRKAWVLVWDDGLLGMGVWAGIFFGLGWLWGWVFWEGIGGFSMGW